MDADDTAFYAQELDDLMSERRHWSHLSRKEQMQAIQLSHTWQLYEGILDFIEAQYNIPLTGE